VPAAYGRSGPQPRLGCLILRAGLRPSAALPQLVPSYRSWRIADRACRLRQLHGLKNSPSSLLARSLECRTKMVMVGTLIDREHTQNLLSGIVPKGPGESQCLLWFTRVSRVEARVGIEPTYKGFADLSLTTWVPRQFNNSYYCTLNLHTAELS
jgi:hypothetical protein